MLEGERLVNSDGGGVNGCDDSSLCLVVVKACRSDDDFFPYFPVHCVLDAEGCCPDVNGGGEDTPGLDARGAVHGELALHTADTLVTEHGLLFAIVAAIHDEGELALIRFLLCACSELTSVDCDQVRVDLHVSLISEDQSAIFDYNTVKTWGRLIDVK